MSACADDEVSQKYYLAVWNEAQNKYQEIIEKTNCSNPSRLELLSKKVEQQKNIFDFYVSQSINPESIYAEKTAEQIEQLIYEISIFSNQLNSVKKSNALDYIKILKSFEDNEKTRAVINEDNEIKIRLINNGDYDYWYVGFSAEEKNVSYLLDGFTGEIIAQKENV